MVSFYPGPSKVHPKSLEFIQEAYRSGIVSINHRSKTFENLYQDTEDILKAKWNIPKDYCLYFVSSATEAWEIVSHSIVINQSAHFYNGAFGQKWAQYNTCWHPESLNFSFEVQQHLSDYIQHAELNYSTADTICLVQSETSNGTGQLIKRSDFSQNPQAIIAVDATSSMGGIELPWMEADVWLASVQKCMGLPAGMGLLICSPNALERARSKGKKSKYNDLLFMEENRLKHQTHFTPNVLSIYLLNQMTHHLPNILTIHANTLAKSQLFEEFLNNFEQKSCDFLIEDPSLRLPTVFTLAAKKTWMNGFFQAAEKQEIMLGKGYGLWNETTFRIANFPSHTTEDFNQLIEFIKHYGL